MFLATSLAVETSETLTIVGVGWPYFQPIHGRSFSQVLSFFASFSLDKSARKILLPAGKKVDGTPAIN